VITLCEIMHQYYLLYAVLSLKMQYRPRPRVHAKSTVWQENEEIGLCCQ